MAVMRWDPFAGFDRMFEMMYGRRGDGGRRLMPIDVYRRGDEYTVEMDLPGADPSSIDVKVENNMLSVCAESRSQHDDADEEIVCERSHAYFERQLYLGEDVDLDRVRATFDNGVLTVRVPRSARAAGRHVEVSVGTGGAQSIEAQSGGSESGGAEQRAAS